MNSKKMENGVRAPKTERATSSMPPAADGGHREEQRYRVGKRQDQAEQLVRKTRVQAHRGGAFEFESSTVQTSSSLFGWLAFVRHGTPPPPARCARGKREGKRTLGL